MMNNYWERKDKGSGNYGDWGHRSSANRRPPQARQKSVPSWEKKFCESICLIPWHKLLEAKKFTYLYDNVVRWNDTAAEEAFKNAKSRFWAEMNGLPCNVKSPDPDTYIDKVDWNTSVDPELLLDLERGPDMDSKTSEAENEIVNNGKLFLLDNEPLCDEGWGYLDKVPVPPNGSAEPQGWINWNETDQCGEILDGSKGWNNWDDYDDDDKNNKYASNCNWEEIGCKNSWNEDRYGNGNMASGRSDPWQGSVNQIHSNQCAYGGQGGEWNNGNGWDHSHCSPGKNVAIDGNGRNPDPRNGHWRRKESGGYWQNRGFKNSRGRKRQEPPRWLDRNPSYGRG